MKKLYTTVLMSIMTIFTVSAQDFEAGGLLYTSNGFVTTDFSPTATDGGDGSVYYGEASSGFSIEYTVPFDISNMTDMDLSYYITDPSFNNNLTVSSIDVKVNGTQFYTLSSVTLSSMETFSISGINGSTISLVFNVDLPSGYGTLSFEYFSLTNTTSSSVGIEETNISDTYNVYSYNNNLVVNTDNYTPYTLTVYNMSGQVVMNQFLSGNVTQPIDVPSGIYLVKVKNENGVVVKKVRL